MKNKNAIKKRQIIILLLVLLMVASLLSACGKSIEPSGGKDLNPRIDAVKYDMHLKLDADAERLHEIVAMTIKNDTEYGISEIIIRNIAYGALEYAKKNYRENGNGNLTTQINGIYAPSMYSARNDGAELAYTTADDESIIIVTLHEKLAPGETSVIMIDMETDIPKRQDRFAVQSDEHGKHFALSFCFPYLADNEVVSAADEVEGAIRKTLIGNIAWDTAPFFDDGENRSADIADYHVEIIVPEGYEVAVPGEYTEASIEQPAEGPGRHCIVTDANGLRDFAFVACNYMEKEEFTAGGVKVNNYYLTGGKYESVYRKLCKLITEDSMRLYQEKLGPYPYKQLTIVECLFGFMFGGMEYPELVMTNGTDFLDGMGPELGAQSLVDGLSHEIAHQWFYSSVGNDEYREGWIDEGFTSYMEREVFAMTDCETNTYLRELDSYALSFEELREDRTDYMRYFKTQWDHLYLNVSPEEYEGDRGYGEGEYEGAFLFLLELREIWGEERFDEFLKTYYKTYAGHIATTSDVVALIRKMDTGGSAEELLAYYIK